MQTVLDRLALLACALFVDLVLAYIVFHPMIAVYLQLGMVMAALAWRFGGFGTEAVAHS